MDLKRLIKSVGHGEKGFTLIELLVVVAILGVIAAVVVLNIGDFLGSGTEEAANTEAHQVQTAVIAYMQANSLTSWSGTIDSSSGDGTPAEYLLNPGRLQADYTIADGVITDAGTTTNEWGETCSFADGEWTCS